MVGDLHSHSALAIVLWWDIRFRVTTIGGLGIFSAFVAYDIQSSIQQYEDGNPLHHIPVYAPSTFFLL